MIHQTTELEWWARYEDALPASYIEFILSEPKATVITEVNCIIPGLLQTERYAAASIAALAPYPMPHSIIAKLVEVRMKRQWHVLEQRADLQLTVLLDESALYRRMGSADIMHEQLQHLQSLASQPFISLQVIPFSATIFQGHSWLSFTVHEGKAPIEFAKVFIEDIFKGNSVIEQSLAVANYQQLCKVIRSQALSVQATQELIVATRQQLELEIQRLPTWQRKVK
jgi:Domain of unknown function (DUF5753)